MGSGSWVSLPFGAGLDRSTGIGLLDPSSFRDVRNVDLQEGRAVARRGFEARTALSKDGLGVTPMTDVVLLHAFRSEGLGVVVGYDDASREVQVFSTSAVGLNPTYLGTWGTPPTDAGRVLALGAESYRKMFLAHDHADLTKRLRTIYFDPTDAPVLQTLQADLDGAGAADVFFRGVQRHLNYLWGWGYGSASEPDRPEVLRASLPGRPDQFRGEHYLLVGSPGEAVLGLAPLRGFAMVLKQTELHRLVGSNRATFGSVLADASFGVAGSRLWAVADSALWFWSLEGPRVSTGDASEDIGIPLDPNGPSPEDLVNAGELADGFACFRRDLRQVEFHFGRRCYVLHLRDRQRLRWSYRENGVELRCSGTFYVGTGSAAPTGHPELGSVTETTGTITVPVTYTDATGDEAIELWLRIGGGSWTLARNQVIANLSGETFELDGADGVMPSTAYDVAVRFRRGLFYTAGYTSTNPLDWPVASRFSGTTDAGAGTPSNMQLVGGSQTQFGPKFYNSLKFSWTAGSPGTNTQVLESTTSDPADASVLAQVAIATEQTGFVGSWLVRETPSLRWFFVRHTMADGTPGDPVACSGNPFNVADEALGQA